MIATQTCKVSYSGNNSTVTAYSIAFPFNDPDDFVVTETDSEGAETTLVKDTDYTLTPTQDGNGRYTGASLVTDVAVPVTSTLLIKRVTPRLQEFNAVAGGRLPAESLESALDRVVMIVQEIARDLEDEVAAIDARLDALEA